ncbi:MAG: hypothetical protein KDD25_03775 [Bdellovibrionales bacterium]|nr:hypothetical protein [Bdellovibrionales bacterium]
MKKSLLLTFGFALLVGCQGSWDEDPLAKYPEDVRNGEFPGSQKPNPIPNNSVFIDSNGFYDFTEGEEQTIEFSYRIAIDGASVKEFYIRNMEAVLPGAQFEFNSKESKGLLTWKPALDFVRGDSYMVSRRLELALVFEKENVPVEVRKEWNANVFRNVARPVILRAESLPSQVNEGGRATFKLVVQDFNSVGPNPDSDQAPSVVVSFNGSSSQKNGASLVTPNRSPYQDSSDRTIWIFEFLLDAGSVDVDSNRAFGYSARAFSQFGEASDIKNYSTNILNKLSIPMTSWSSSVNVKMNQENTLNFVAFDMKSEGSISVHFLSGCDDGVACRCFSGSGSFVRNCEVQWAPENTSSRQIRYRVLKLQSSNTESKEFVGTLRPISSAGGK